MFIDAFADPFEAIEAIRSLVRRTAPDGFEPDAMVLATADGHGRPAARVVLLRGVDRDGLLFYTNYDSRKGRDLDTNPQAALCGHWYWLKQQIRIEGRVARAAAADSDAYFAGRPRESQLGAWASQQSRPLASRAELEARVADAGARFAGREVPRPPFWGGYRLAPVSVEFWEEGPARLHDRILFQAGPAGWTKTRLSP